MSNDDNTTATASTVSTAIEKMGTLSSGVGIVSTFTADTLEGRKATLKAVTTASPINENLDKVINLRHVVTQVVTIVDDVTKLPNEVVRIILIDEDGSAYAAVSDGLLGSLRDVFGILGHPSTWEAPLPITVTEKRSRAGRRFMTIELA